MSDLISRQAAIDAINHICPVDTEYDCTLLDRVDVRYVLSDLPSAQPERDIPVKPIETDMAWGIPNRQAICPRCRYYLVNVVFVGAEQRVTYCEHCGQAIDWEGWDFDG